jgi:hypothetical protein
MNRVFLCFMLSTLVLGSILGITCLPFTLTLMLTACADLPLILLGTPVIIGKTLKCFPGD